MKILLSMSLLLLPLLAFAQCPNLSRRTNPKNKEVQVFTTLEEPVTVARIINGDTTQYYLRLKAPAKPAADRKGVKLFFANGEQLTRPDEVVQVDYETYHPQWNSDVTAWAVILLTKQELDLLGKNLIRSYELDSFGWVVNENLSESYKQEMICLSNVNPKVVKERKGK